jgi:integrase
MLTEDVTRYVELHRALGFKFRVQNYLLCHFARYVESRNDCFVRNETVLAWAAEAPSSAQRRSRLLVVRRFARSMQAEDARHEVPPAEAFGRPTRNRRSPHIYTADELQHLLGAAARLTPKGSLRSATYVTLLSLLASTGIRISEALSLQLDDITHDGLLIRNTKFRKSRLVPLHTTAREGLDRYLVRRKEIGGEDRSVFVSMWGTQMAYPTVRAVFLELMRSIGLRGKPGTSGPCIHDHSRSPPRSNPQVRSLGWVTQHAHDWQSHAASNETTLRKDIEPDNNRGSIHLTKTDALDANASKPLSPHADSAQTSIRPPLETGNKTRPL